MVQRSAVKCVRNVGSDPHSLTLVSDLFSLSGVSVPIASVITLGISSEKGGLVQVLHKLKMLYYNSHLKCFRRKPAGDTL